MPSFNLKHINTHTHARVHTCTHIYIQKYINLIYCTYIRTYMYMYYIFSVN